MIPRLAIRGVLLAALLPFAAAAQEAPKDGEIFAALTGDWNGDGTQDAAMLVQNGADAADLVIYLGDPTFGLKREMTVERVVFSGQMGGQTPSLEPLSDSAFKLHSEQIGIGRTPWESAYSIAWRNGGFVVSGYSYRYYDRIDPEDTGTCDVNLLNGDYVMTRRGQTAKGSQDRRAFPLSTLHADWMPMICTGLFQ